MTPPEETSAFKPINNPFYTGNPVRNPNLFFGREDNFTYLEQRLAVEKEGFVLLFVGGRRSGKTSIMWQILNGRLGDQYLPIFVDMQKMAGITSDHDFFGRLAEATLEWAKDERLILDYYKFNEANPLLTFDRFMVDLQAVYPGRKLIFLVDEVEIFYEKTAKGELSSAILTYMASLLETKQVSFFLTGSPGVGDSPGEEWRRLIAKAVTKEIFFLTFDDAKRLIQIPVEGQVTYEDGLPETIYKLTHGHPYYTQFVCNFAVDYLNSLKRDNHFTHADLDEVLHTIIDNPPPQLVFEWDQLDEEDQLTLSLLSETAQEAQVPVTAEDLQETIKANHYPLPKLNANTLHINLENLYKAKILERQGQDGFFFFLDLFRLWIRQQRSVWRLVGETAPQKTRRKLWAGLATVALVLVVVLGIMLGGKTATDSTAGRAGAPPVTIGKLWARSHPPGATLWRVTPDVNGKKAVLEPFHDHPTPTYIPALEPGTYHLVARLPGYHDAADSVEIAVGETDSLDFQLKRIKGKLRINAPNQGASVTITGEENHSFILPLDPLELPTGEYQIVISQPNHLPETHQLSIVDTATITLDVALRARVGGLTIRSKPPGATVYLNGKPTGRTTPADFANLAVGTHRIALTLADHRRLEFTQQIRLDQTATVDQTLPLLPASIELITEPSAAAVYLDGGPSVWKTTPVVNDSLPPGRHTFRIVREGYQTAEFEAHLKPALRFSRTIQLVELFGTVRIVNPRFGTIVIDETIQKEIPPVDISLRVGVHRLKRLGSDQAKEITVYQDSLIKVRLD